MSIVEGIVSFVIVWWAVLFAVLPFGIRSQHEDGTVEPGTDPGAPVAARMWRKVLVTTMVSLVIWGLFAWAMVTGILALDDLPGYGPVGGTTS